MILTILIIALAVNGLLINPAYLWILNRLNLDTKPFNCPLCLGWWLGVIYIVIQVFLVAFTLQLVLVPLAASFLAVAFHRWFESLPVRIK
jgi:hypothetical protein